MNTVFPEQWPVTILASIKFGLNDLHINRVPLHRPDDGSIFRNKMIGQLSFKCSKLGGMPFGVNLLRNSMGYV